MENGLPTSKPNLAITSKFIKAVEEGRLVPFVREEPVINRELGTDALMKWPRNLAAPPEWEGKPGGGG